MPKDVVAAPRLLLLTFSESAGTILLERGAYFFTHEVLQFSQARNLWLALAFGAAYAAGAACSHAASDRVGERRLLISLMGCLLIAHGALAALPEQVPLLWAVFPAIGFVRGMQWPIVESYVAAGSSPEQVLRVLGRFNVSWALAVPLAMAASGPLIESGWPALLYAVAGALTLPGLLLVSGLPPAPAHAPPGEPLSTGVHVRRDAALLICARFTMLGSYSLMFLVAPLMPGIFESVGFELRLATVAASLLDWVRVATFAILGHFAGWRGRPLPLIAALLGVGVGAWLLLVSPHAAGVLAGEVLFGVASALSFYAAIYYAMVLGNAAVGAGGAHESLIGVGFFLGPAAGLLGQLLPFRPSAASFVAIAPFFVLCAVAAGRALVRGWR